MIKVFEKVKKEFFNCFESLFFGFAILDLSGNFLQVNEKICDLFSCSKKELLHKRLSDFFPLKEREFYAQKVKEMICEKLPLNMFEAHLFQKNANPTALFIMALHEDEEKRSSYLSLQVFETPLKKNPSSDLLNEDLFRNVFENAPIGIVIASPEGKILLSNRSFNDFLQYSSTEMRRMTVADITHPHSLKGSKKAISNLRKDLINKILLEKKYLRKDKKIVWGMLSASKYKNPSGDALYNIAQIIDIEEQKKMERDLHLKSLEREFLTQKLLSAHEEERKKIAGEIHDELGQLLTTLKIEIACVKKACYQKKNSDTCPLHEKHSSNSFQNISYLLDETINTVRRITSNLRPPLLDNLGLAEAITYHFDSFKKIFEGNCSLEISENFPTTSINLSTALFRIFQEALNNILKHAKASQVLASLKLKSKKIILQVQDNGIGISRKKKNKPTCLGILGIKERTAAYNGNVFIGPPKDKKGGNLLKVSIPLSNTILRKT